MPWDMHRLTVGEWQKITKAAADRNGNETDAGELPEGWENLPVEGE